MSELSIRRSKWLAYPVLAAFVIFTVPSGPLAAAPREVAAGGTLSGFIYAKDVTSPVAGAVVKIRSVIDHREFASSPTEDNGMYKITGVPEGRYMLGVTSGDDDFNLDYVLYVKAGELARLSISLASGPGGGGQEAGTASVKKTGFFNSVAGRALIVAAVGVGLYFVIVPQGESSPIR